MKKLLCKLLKSKGTVNAYSEWNNMYRFLIQLDSL